VYKRRDVVEVFAAMLAATVSCVACRYPCYENPYPMDIHDSPVTSCLYFADCPPDLIPAYYSVGSKSKPKTGYSDKVVYLTVSEPGSRVETKMFYGRSYRIHCRKAFLTPRTILLWTHILGECVCLIFNFVRGSVVL